MPRPLVRNLIFDLGGVILDLAVKDTLAQFSSLSSLPVETVTRVFTSSPEFDQYEKGLLSDDAFRAFVRKAYGVDAPDAEIDRCWNAMLVNIPKVKLELLDALRNQYRVFLLSNTNNIHLQYINHVILKNVAGHADLDRYFHKAYYSQRMLKRKPEPEIFQQVLDENDLVAEETLFLDDNAANVEAASKLGIRTVHIMTANHILEIFHE